MSERLYPPNCSECGYNLSGADLSKRPVQCPECGVSNPIFERNGKRYSWRGPSSKLDANLSKAANTLDLEGWEDIAGSPVVRALLGNILFVFVVSCCLCTSSGLSEGETYTEDIWEKANP